MKPKVSKVVDYYNSHKENATNALICSWLTAYINSSYCFVLGKSVCMQPGFRGKIVDGFIEYIDETASKHSRILISFKNSYTDYADLSVKSFKKYIRTSKRYNKLYK